MAARNGVQELLRSADLDELRAKVEAVPVEEARAVKGLVYVAACCEDLTAATRRPRHALPLLPAGAAGCGLPAGGRWLLAAGC